MKKNTHKRHTSLNAQMLTQKKMKLNEHFQLQKQPESRQLTNLRAIIEKSLAFIVSSAPASTADKTRAEYQIPSSA